MTEEQFEKAREALREQSKEVRQQLVEDGVLDPPNPGPIYAWRIRDHIEDRDYLSLSANEAAHYEWLDETSVTIVTWESFGGRVDRIIERERGVLDELSRGGDDGS